MNVTSALLVIDQRYTSLSIALCQTIAQEINLVKCIGN